MLFEQWKLGPMDNFVYAFGSERGTDLAIVDPAFELEELLTRVEGLGRQVTDLIATHGHWDHVQGIPKLKEKTGATVWAHESARHPHDRALRDGETHDIAGVPTRTYHTPGHAPDAVCMTLNDTHLLTGDTLFVGECGRVDLPGSDPMAMHGSLLHKIAKLSPDLLVCPGHDYGAQPMTTLEHELKHNYTLQPRTLAEFVQFLKEP